MSKKDAIDPIRYGLERILMPDQIDELKKLDFDEIKNHFAKLERQAEIGCTCKDCEKKRANLERHLEHQFYKDAAAYREQERIGQIVKGSEKYKEPFDPNSWTPKQLLQHAMQENVDQGHYIYGLYLKIDFMEQELERYMKEAEYWKARALKAEAKQGKVIGRSFI